MLSLGRSDAPPRSSVELNGESGSVLVSRPGPAIVFLSVAGRSAEDLPDALSHELETDFVIQGELTLFLDARAVAAAELMRSPRWFDWFRRHREHMARVVVLVDASVARAVVETARGAGGLGDRLELFTDVNAFERTRVITLRTVVDSGTWHVSGRPSDEHD